jgi:hypothetical protein
MDHSKIRLLELVVAGRHPAEFFELAEKPFYFVAMPVRSSVQTALGRAIRLVRDYGRRAVVSASLALWLSIETFVTDDLVDLLHSLGRLIEYCAQMRSVVILARYHVDRDYRVLVRGRCNNFGAEAAAAPTERLIISGPLFCSAPAAWRCARTTVESTKTRLTSSNSGLSVSNSNNLAKLPLWIHRRNRLYTASHEPNSAGRSRQGMPVRPMYNNASKNIRSGNFGRCPLVYRLAVSTSGSITFQSSSVSKYRMASVPRRGSRGSRLSAYFYTAVPSNVNRT